MQGFERSVYQGLLAEEIIQLKYETTIAVRKCSLAIKLT